MVILFLDSEKNIKDVNKSMEMRFGFCYRTSGIYSSWNLKSKKGAEFAQILKAN